MKRRDVVGVSDETEIKMYGIYNVEKSNIKRYIYKSGKEANEQSRMVIKVRVGIKCLKENGGKWKIPRG